MKNLIGSESNKNLMALGRDSMKHISTILCSLGPELNLNPLVDNPQIGAGGPEDYERLFWLRRIPLFQSQWNHLLA